MLEVTGVGICANLHTTLGITWLCRRVSSESSWTTVCIQRLFWTCISIKFPIFFLWTFPPHLVQLSSVSLSVNDEYGEIDLLLWAEAGQAAAAPSTCVASHSLLCDWDCGGAFGKLHLTYCRFVPHDKWCYVSSGASQPTNRLLLDIKNHLYFCWILTFLPELPRSALYVAWYSIQLATRRNHVLLQNQTYGWQRAEILGALVNGVFLLGWVYNGSERGGKRGRLMDKNTVVHDLTFSFSPLGSASPYLSRQFNDS